MANSRREKRIGLPANRIQISYFLLTFKSRTMMYWQNAPENGGFSSREITFPNVEFFKNSNYSASRAAINASVHLVL